MSDADAIAALLREYLACSDGGRFEAWAQLFTRDGRFVAFGRSVSGREALRDFIAAAAEGAHGGEVLAIEIEGERATARSRFRFEARDPRFHSRGHYLDRLRREDGCWRFEERAVEFEARGPGALAD